VKEAAAREAKEECIWVYLNETSLEVEKASQDCKKQITESKRFFAAAAAKR